MSLRKQVSLIIYRFRERGLEVFLINQQPDNWDLPQGEMNRDERVGDLIELDSVEQPDGRREDAWAVEGDWHEIPSLKSMMYEDANLIKEKLKDVENGAYVAIKDALKSALPHQYAFLKELKDILTDRNSVRDI